MTAWLDSLTGSQVFFGCLAIVFITAVIWWLLAHYKGLKAQPAKPKPFTPVAHIDGDNSQMILDTLAKVISAQQDQGKSMDLMAKRIDLAFPKPPEPKPPRPVTLRFLLNEKGAMVSEEGEPTIAPELMEGDPADVPRVIDLIKRGVLEDKRDPTHEE